jgi:integrase
MRKPTLTIRPYPHSKTHRFVLDLRPFGQGRKFFRSRDEAKAERLRVLNTLKKHGRDALELSGRDISDFVTAKRQLAEYGKTITDAANFLVDHQQRIRRCKITISQLADEVLETKRKDGRSRKYVEMLRLYFKRFCRDFGDRLIADITVEELDNWLRDLPVAPLTRADYRRNIGVLFSHAAQRRIIDSNPVGFTAKPKVIDTPPEIFTVDELCKLLESAQRQQPEVLPMLAIGAFAGLREAEIKRLDWTNVKLSRRHIDVTAAKAKSARRRIVPIQPNLAAWLRPYVEMTGAVVPFAARGKLERVRKSAGITRWPKNGLRHSFASYRLAATNDAPRVAAELGHATPQLLYSAYRELVAPEEAQRYWEIAPAAEAENVVEFSEPATTG